MSGRGPEKRHSGDSVPTLPPIIFQNGVENISGVLFALILTAGSGQMGE
jgi:hypothetical protein